MGLHDSNNGGNGYSNPQIVLLCALWYYSCYFFDECGFPGTIIRTSLLWARLYRDFFCTGKVYPNAGTEKKTLWKKMLIWSKPFSLFLGYSFSHLVETLSNMIEYSASICCINTIAATRTFNNSCAVKNETAKSQILVFWRWINKW